MYREPKLPHVLCGLSFCEARHFVRPLPVPKIKPLRPKTGSTCSKCLESNFKSFRWDLFYMVEGHKKNTISK